MEKCITQCPVVSALETTRKVNRLLNELSLQHHYLKSIVDLESVGVEDRQVVAAFDACLELYIDAAILLEDIRIEREAYPEGVKVIDFFALQLESHCSDGTVQYVTPDSQAMTRQCGSSVIRYVD